MSINNSVVNHVGNSGREMFSMDSKHHQFGNNDDDNLFLSLKCHIDSQQKLIQLYRTRIRSFEMFRKYCQRWTHFDGGGSETIKFDLKQFQNEYNKFDLNYRYFRKRIRNLRKQTKPTLSIRNQNVYDILYDLAAKLESNDNFENRYFFGDQNYPEVSINEVIESNESAINSTISNRGNTQDKSIQCDFNDFSSVCTSSIINVEPRKQTVKLRKKVNTLKTKSSTKQTPKVKSSRKTDSKTNKSTKSKRVLKKIKQETGTDSSTDSNSSPQKKTKTKTKSPTKLLKCDVEGCQYSTTTLNIMKRHQKTHSDVRPFKCDKCELAFKYKGDLKRHENIHEGKRFPCSFEGCTANYSTKKDIQRHIKILHTKEAPLIHCKWEGCDYTTYYISCLNMHRKVHTDQRPHKCPDCEMAFKTRNNLVSHQLTHQTERRFKCDFEGCEYASYSKELLQSHQSVHNVDRPFRCVWSGCEMSFKWPSGLWKHKAMHENQRRYKCKWDGCEFSANLSSGLRLHIQTVHEKKKILRIRNRRKKRPAPEPTILPETNNSLEMKINSAIEAVACEMFNCFGGQSINQQQPTTN